jgi:putative endonuclease
VNSKSRGDFGEDIAARHLQVQGFHIVKRNLRCRSGEVDIVVYKDDTLAFVEVKHWLTLSVQDLNRSISPAKRTRILRCAEEFVTLHPEWRPCRVRFDIVFVGREGVSHFPHAFTENGFQ